MSNSEEKPSRDVNSIWYKFGTRTTIQGISHYYQRSGTNGKWWLCCAIIGIILTTIHLYLHAKNFFSMPIKTNVQHKTNDFVFPDITMCSTSPLVGELYFKAAGAMQGGYTDRDAMALGMLYNYAEINKSSTKMDKNIHRQSLYLQMSTYYTLNRGYAKSELISYCKYQGEPCDDDDLQIRTDANYYNCFTFRPKNRKFHSLEPEDGLLMIINTHSTSLLGMQEYRDKQETSNNGGRVVDSELAAQRRHRVSSSDDFADLLTPENEPTGLKLEIHPARTHPHIRQRGFILSNGKYVEVGLDMITEEQLDTPSRPCKTDDYFMTFKRYIREDGTVETSDYEKTYQDCIGIVKQAHIFRVCKCYSHFFPFESPSQGELCYNYTSLLNRVIDNVKPPPLSNSTQYSTYVNFTNKLLSDNEEKRKAAEEFQKRVKCHDDITGKKKELGNLEGLSKCVTSLPCRREKYTWNWSNAEWPRDFDLEDLINRTLLNSFRNSITGELSRTARLLMNFTEDGKRWSTTDEIMRKNFLKLIIHPLDLKTNVHQEEYSYTVWEALSEIGGIIGLWIGMSLLAICELIELGCNVVWHLACRKKRSQDNAAIAMIPA